MGHPNIEQRKFTFCPTIAGFPLSRLIVECAACTRFFAACCSHKSFGGDWFQPEGDTCHHFQMVFTDGACSNNGLVNARAGLGITLGGDEEYSWSISVNDTIDPGAPRTNQRAELLAAIEGLKKLNVAGECNGKPAKHHNNEDFYRSTYIVVTDSEYVVKGITEWLPSWRKRGWRTSEGKRPANLDLFLTLDEYVTSLEHNSVVVGFLHVPRAYNHDADSLAKRATMV